MSQEYNKKYYQEHKYVYKSKYNVNTTCLCGAVVKKKNLIRHNRSKKCIKNLL